MTYRRICISTSVLLLMSAGVHAANWQECNGTPVRPKNLPLGLVVNTCSFPDLKIPEGIPRGTPLKVFSAIHSDGFPADERRGYDDCARSAINLTVPPVSVCGK